MTSIVQAYELMKPWLGIASELSLAQNFIILHITLTRGSNSTYFFSIFEFAIPKKLFVVRHRPILCSLVNRATGYLPLLL